MNARCAALVTCLLAAGAQAAPDVRIPADRRIEARVVRTQAAPPDQPMHMPTDVAVDAAGRVFVADGANDRIVRFNSEGAFDGAFAELGTEKLNRPVALTIDARQRLWIADSGHHRLLIASGEGALIERIELPDAGDRGPFDPTGVAVTADGKRTYVVDNDHHRLVIRDNQTGKLKILGRFGRGIGQFQWPFMICIGRDGDVYVSEVLGTRVQRISAGDRWAGQVGRWGVELGQLYRPKGLAVDHQGRLYVSDSTLGVVQVFDSRGRLKGVLTSADGAPLRFDHPMGLSLDREGHLYVVELRADRVVVVSLGAEVSATPASPAERAEVASP